MSRDLVRIMERRKTGKSEGIDSFRSNTRHLIGTASKIARRDSHTYKHM